MYVVLAALGGFLLDLLLGDPGWMPHPVVFMGRCISALEKRLKKVENVQENDIKQDMRQLFEGQRTTLEKFQSVNEINDRVKDIQGATDVLKVLTVKKV